MRTKDFIYYASAAVLMAMTTQVASADEVATQMPTVTEGNQYQPATAAEIFGGGAVLTQETPSARPSSTVRQHLQQQVRWQTQVLHTSVKQAQQRL
ncbi:hypothetical protein [Streptococcus salivarius]|uniref:hypothetical protein n=1 Tax=Streptococcus salivarius TaxID=1304 RepID=UPI0020C8543E|nr:hypothetical protein [Streptococcus salivarius]MCP9061284.1 hypothetical protein [Streptococcus salivarius]MCP9063197.1 hypothetical protein [Streptococcus salivarius]